MVTAGLVDFADIEMRVLAAMADPEVTSLVIDFGARQAGFVILPGGLTSVSAMLEEHFRVSKAALKPKRPDYLRHDPTKQHRRQR